MRRWWQRTVGAFDWYARADTIAGWIFGPTLLSKILTGGGALVAAAGAGAWAYAKDSPWSPIIALAALLLALVITHAAISIIMHVREMHRSKKIPDWAESEPETSLTTGASPARSELSIQTAALEIYEAAEREGWLEHVTATQVDPEIRLQTFYFMILIQAREGAIALRGIKPPSRQRMALPSEQMRNLTVHPSEDSLLYVIPLNTVAFKNVTISRDDLDKVIATYRKIATETELLPLKQAAQIVYDETRHSLVAGMSRAFESSAEEALQSTATMIVHHAPELSGSVLASTILDPIPQEERKSFVVFDDMASVGHAGQRKAKYFRISVKRSDLQPVIDYIKRIGGYNL